jgi:hypothetical protein
VRYKGKKRRRFVTSGREENIEDGRRDLEEEVASQHGRK